MLVNWKHLFYASLGLVLNLTKKTKTTNNPENSGKIDHHEYDVDVVNNIKAPLLTNYCFEWHKAIITG